MGLAGGWDERTKAGRALEPTTMPNPGPPGQHEVVGPQAGRATDLGFWLGKAAAAEARVVIEAARVDYAHHDG